jgi:uncharacterized protein YdaU (DUF1376 family)
MKPLNPRGVIGGNLGPPLGDDDIKLQFVMFNIRDMLETLRTMPLVERGYYTTALFVMYERMGMLPADDKKAAMAMGIDVRQYRFLKPKMIETGRFRDTAGGFTNDRVQDEITIAVRKIRARHDAALTREVKKREERSCVADTSQGEIDGKIAERSPRDRREIASICRRYWRGFFEKTLRYQWPGTTNRPHKRKRNR